MAEQGSRLSGLAQPLGPLDHVVVRLRLIGDQADVGKLHNGFSLGLKSKHRESRSDSIETQPRRIKNPNDERCNVFRHSDELTGVND